MNRSEVKGAAGPRPQPAEPSREERRAAALRANLKRRKAQARGREADEGEVPEAGEDKR